jgi:hypothetical protein
LTGLPVCCRSFATIQFSKPPSPLPLGRAGPEIDSLVGEEKPTRRVGFGYRPNLLGSYPIAPPRLSSRFRSLTKGLYHLASRFQTPTGEFSWYATLFAPIQAPLLSAGRCLQVVRISRSLCRSSTAQRPPEVSASGILARVPGTSSGTGDEFGVQPGALSLA